MKLTAQIKLITTKEHGLTLKQTLGDVNTACNRISEIAWDQKKFSQFPLHRACYYVVRETFGLSAQPTVRAISKVADSYKLDKKHKRRFKLTGAIAYDSRIIRFNLEDQTVNIWTVDGRKTIPFICGEQQLFLLQHQRGESDLVLHRGKFYILATCEVEDPTPTEADKILGIDLGIVNIATDSEGQRFSGEQIEKTRQRHDRLRKALQKRGTKSAKRHLKKLSGKQQRFQRNTNHVISKRIVHRAKALGADIAVENLKGIRSATVRKAQRAKHSNWGFYQLKQFLAYKARMLGVRLFEVDPKHTSQECSQCHHIEKRNRKSQSLFSCVSCGFSTLADFNAAINIAARASVREPIVAAT